MSPSFARLVRLSNAVVQASLGAASFSAVQTMVTGLVASRCPVPAMGGSPISHWLDRWRRQAERLGHALDDLGEYRDCLMFAKTAPGLNRELGDIPSEAHRVGEEGLRCSLREPRLLIGNILVPSRERLGRQRRGVSAARVSARGR